jgi:lipopolysaccharide biosynthesis regulator YciM
MPESNMNSAEEDLNLIMTMMRSIKPGDMSEEAANELMMIGRRIQNGGRLSDQERDAITQVMRAMPADKSEVRTYMVDGQPVQMTPQQYENAVRSGEITQDEMSYTVDGRAMAATPMQMSDMQRSMGAGAMTDAEKRIAQEEAFQRMIMEQNEMQQRAMDQRMMNDINSGSLAPMTSPRPRARPMR